MSDQREAVPEPRDPLDEACVLLMALTEEAAEFYKNRRGHLDIAVCRRMWEAYKSDPVCYAAMGSCPHCTVESTREEAGRLLRVLWFGNLNETLKRAEEANS